ncbi:MAG: hypothetical protein LBE91_16580, partial [Tannerella sp.]|nr:hypothetical protein [Tannerella sp.]
MKYSIIIPILLLTGCSANPEIECVQLDPLEKVLKEQIYFEENADTAAVVKGETATFQFVLRSIHAIQNLKIEATDLTDENQAIPVGV